MPQLVLNSHDKKVITQHIKSWQVFTRDMVTALQVEQWIFSKADLEIENLYKLTESGAPEDEAKADYEDKMRNYSSMEKLVILWNQYCLKRSSNSFSRGEVKRWMEHMVE